MGGNLGNGKWPRGEGKRHGDNGVRPGQHGSGLSDLAGPKADAEALSTASCLGGQSETGWWLLGECRVSLHVLPATCVSRTELSFHCQSRQGLR